MGKFKGKIVKGKNVKGKIVKGRWGVGKYKGKFIRGFFGFFFERGRCVDARNRGLIVD